jgi:hypothetical protein
MRAANSNGALTEARGHRGGIVATALCCRFGREKSSEDFADGTDWKQGQRVCILGARMWREVFFCILPTTEEPGSTRVTQLGRKKFCHTLGPLSAIFYPLSLGGFVRGIGLRVTALASYPTIIGSI